MLTDRESAEYCASDLYSLVEGDVVFFLPDSGKGVERSNYKSSLSVQRTSAVGKLISNKENKEKLFVVTYPEALEEKLPKEAKMSGALVKIKKGESISFDDIRNILTREGFEKSMVMVNGSPTLRMRILIDKETEPKILVLNTGSTRRVYPIGKTIKLKGYNNNFIIVENKII